MPEIRVKMDFEVSIKSDFRHPASDFQVAQIAQLVEQWTENPRVAGSIPALGTIAGNSGQRAEKRTKKKFACLLSYERSEFSLMNPVSVGCSPGYAGLTQR